jgi:hypothetical protein
MVNAIHDNGYQLSATQLCVTFEILYCASVVVFVRIACLVTYLNTFIFALSQ